MRQLYNHTGIATGSMPTLKTQLPIKAQVKAVCDLYQAASILHEQGIHLISTDEMTAIQALARAHPTMPMRPGHVELQEFEYIRHGDWGVAGGFPSVDNPRTRRALKA